MNSDIKLGELIVMQDSLRHTVQVPGMIEFVRTGGFWTQESLKAFAVQNKLSRVSPVMEIIRFPDKKLMVHDGHHRIVATYLAGRNYLRGNEYVYNDWSYDDYLEINFGNRWVTPFDPRIEIRAADIGVFKKEALELAKSDPDAAIRFILDSKQVYVKPREVHGVTGLVQKYLNRSEETQERIIHEHFNVGA